MKKAAAIGWRSALLGALVWGLALTGCGGLESGGGTATGGELTVYRGGQATDHSVGTVTGRLLTEVGRYPVAGARVAIGGNETTTGSTGVFWISNVAVGVHLLEVTADGHSLLWGCGQVQVAVGTTDLGDIELIADKDIPGPVPPSPPGLK